MSWLYLARRSDLQGAPVFICKAFPKTNTVVMTCTSFPWRGRGFCLQTPSLSSRPVRGLGLTYLPSAQSYDQISNEGVFGLPRSVAHHHTPAVLLGQLAAARSEKCSQQLPLL